MIGDGVGKVETDGSAGAGINGGGSKRKEEGGERLLLPVVYGLDAWKEMREFVRLDLFNTGTAPLRNGNNDVVGVEGIS